MDLSLSMMARMWISLLNLSLINGNPKPILRWYQFGSDGIRWLDIMTPEPPKRHRFPWFSLRIPVDLPMNLSLINGNPKPILRWYQMVSVGISSDQMVRHYDPRASQKASISMVFLKDPCGSPYDSIFNQWQPQTNLKMVSVRI